MSQVQASQIQQAVSKPGAAPDSAPAGAVRAAGSIWLWAMLAVALARGILYTFVAPPWQHSDEPTHFEHVRIIAETGRLPGEDFVSLPIRWEIARSMQAHEFWRHTEQTEPVVDDASLSPVGVSVIGIYTYAQPRLYYVVAAAWLWPWLGQPVDVQLYVVRLFGVLLNLIVVACGYLAARLVFPVRPALAVAVAGFLVFEPELTDVMSAANNDVLVNALAAAFYLALAVLYFRGWRWIAAATGVLTLAAGLLTKTTAIISLISLPLAVLCYPWRRQTRLILFGSMVLLGAAGLALAAALYLAPGPLRRELVSLAGRYFRIQVGETWAALLSSARVVPLRSAALVVFWSFWAAFGWRNVTLDPIWYWLPGAAMAAAGLGLAAQAGSRVYAAWRRRLSPEAARRVGYLLYCGGAALLAWVITIIRSQAVQGMNRYHSHGRYAFVAIVPFALLFAAGLLGWLPETWQRRGLWVFLAAMFAFDALAFWGYLVPFFYFRA